MFRHLEFCGTNIGRGTNKHLYLFGSGHHCCRFCACVKRKNYLDVGIGHSIDFGRAVYIRKEEQAKKINAQMNNGFTIYCPPMRLLHLNEKY